MVEFEFSVKEGRGKNSGWDIKSDMGGTRTLQESLEFFRTMLVQVAKTALKDSQSKGEFPENKDDFLVAVDGRLDKPIEKVKTFGRIEFSRKADVGEMVLELYQHILDRSPIYSGQYYDSNLVFLNGTLIASNKAELEMWVKRGTYRPQQADVFRFVNTMPYAKRLETRGIIRGRERGSGNEGDRKSRTRTLKSGVTYRVPTGAYQLAANAINRKYRLNAFIKFKMLSGADITIPSGINKVTGKPHRTTTKGTKTKKAGIPYVYPSIYFYVREWGVQ